MVFRSRYIDIMVFGQPGWNSARAEICPCHRLLNPHRHFPAKMTKKSVIALRALRQKTWPNWPNLNTGLRKLYRLGRKNTENMANMFILTLFRILKRFSSDKFTPMPNNVLKLADNTMGKKSDTLGKKSDTLAMCSHLDKKSNRLSWRKFWEQCTEESWPEKCCFKDCTSKLKPLNNAGLYEIKKPNKLVTIPACNECKFNSENFRYLCETKAAIVTEEDMLDFRYWRLNLWIISLNN